MSNAHRRRRSRRRLKAHTRYGENRHDKAAQVDAKLKRLGQEHHAGRS